ncbi:hypothetical protein [Sulfuracidifex tepidarius]|nr:hypothetical protein [Sulfuracidifex tepidarius]
MNFKVIILSILIILSIFTLLFEFPINGYLSPGNNGPYGMSKVFSELGNSSKTTMIYLVLTPSYNASYLYSYVEDGNTLILAGNLTFLNDLLSKMNVSMLLTTGIYVNYTSFYQIPENVVAYYHGISMVFPSPHPILGGIPLVKSGHYALISQERLGKGKLIVFSTPDFFMNKYVNAGYQNLDFLKQQIGRSSIAINSPQPLIIYIRAYLEGI